jgi:hypothetical protein
MSHEQTQIHKTHHSPDLRKATTFPPYSILCAWPRGQHPNVILSQDSQVGVLKFPKFPKLGLLWLWRPIISFAKLQSRWGLKQSYSLHPDLSNDMCHTTCTKINRGDSRLLVVENQISNLTPGLPFGHNLCFNYPNGSCEPILDI